MNSEYKMEELVPIVAKLAEKYTAYESTSVTYERAEKWMEAVLYCIHEAEQAKSNSALSAKGMTAQQMYDIGRVRVEEKVKKALSLYNEILPEFTCYESRCLQHAFVKELPRFFQWYDARFEPQNAIVALDYPVLKDIFQYTGIDRVYEFIKCISLEQKFLRAFPREYVTGALSKYDMQYEEMMENICEIVFMSMTGHILAGRSLAELVLEEKDYLQIRSCLAQTKLPVVKKQLMQAVEAFLQKYCGDDCGDLLEYLDGSADGVLVRLENAAEHGCLHQII